MAVFAMPRARALDSNVNAMSGAKLYFYSPGTSTEKAVYSDSGLTTPIAQPVTADSAVGRLHADGSGQSRRLAD